MAGATVLLALLAAGCDTAIARPPEASLRAGYDSRDGSLEVWPPRGGLAGDDRAMAGVTAAVEQWRSPVEDRVHLPSSGVLWLGEAGGGPLALVAANVPGESASWLLQVTGGGDDYTVERAVEYTDPGYLVYSDVLPVQLPTGRHYLASTRVERLLGPTGQPVAFTDGLSGPVAVPACAASTLTVGLRATEALPDGRSGDKLIDLGSGVEAPRYPLLRDDSGAAGTILTGLDTCALAGPTGMFGSIPHRFRDRNHPESVPASWPIDRLATRPLGEIPFGGGPAELEQLTWRSDEGTMTAAVARPPGGAPVATKADRISPLQTYELPVPGGQPLVVLVWRVSTDSALSVPLGTVRLVDRPGLVVVEKPVERQTFSLSVGDKTTQRQVGGES
nr:hypothetical protein [Micromonospora sp. DSM 115978]